MGWAINVTVAVAFALTAVPPAHSKIAPASEREAAVKAKMEMILVDPDSAKYKFGIVECAEWVVAGTKLWSGYEQKLLVNAKNRMGGYNGWEAFLVLYQGDGPELAQLFTVEEVVRQSVTLTGAACPS